MSASFSIINCEELSLSTLASFSLDILNGLSSTPKTIPSKYLYDERGSLLFEQITEQIEYYPTNCEVEILNRRKEDISRLTQFRPFRLLELGVGDARKTKLLLKHFLESGLDFEYILVDCCRETIRQTINQLKIEFSVFPLTAIGLAGDYSSAFGWLNGQQKLKTIVLFLGSSIGNFEPKQMINFFNGLWNSLNHEDAVFIGFDLKKNIDTLQLAYNDKAGITREFNLNLLDRMNREFNATFDRNFFIHHSFYNPAQSRMESWIVSTCSQTVTFEKLHRSIHFEPWEGIHVESSYKYNLEEIETLAQKMGFIIDEKLMDSKGYFVDAIWHVNKKVS